MNNPCEIRQTKFRGSAWLPRLQNSTKGSPGLPELALADNGDVNGILVGHEVSSTFVMY